MLPTLPGILLNDLKEKKKKLNKIEEKK